MSCHSCGQSPCACCGGFTQLSPHELRHTLVQALTPCVDQVRDLFTQFGARPYTVRLVWTRWSGGERGVGREEVVRDEPILPTPKLALGGVSRELQSIGVEDVGTVTVSEISARYTEDFLLGRCDDGSRIAEDQSFYWEITHARPDGLAARRRFVVSGVPSLEATSFEWEVRLTKVAEDRTRSGDPRG